MHELGLALAFLLLMTVSTLAGMALRARLPSEHTSDSSREAVLRSVGLVVTVASLVMAFLVSTAKSYYTSVEDELTEISSDVAGLDHLLERYGAEADPARRVLREFVGSAVHTLWPHHATALPRREGASGRETLERLSSLVAALPAVDPDSAALQRQALDYVLAIEHAGFKLVRLREARAQTPLLAIIVSWLVIIFAGFGLLTPRNRTALLAMFLAAATAAGALFLIIEFYSPVTGMIAVPPSVLEISLAP